MCNSLQNGDEIDCPGLQQSTFKRLVLLFTVEKPGFKEAFSSCAE